MPKQWCKFGIVVVWIMHRGNYLKLNLVANFVMFIN